MPETFSIQVKHLSEKLQGEIELAIRPYAVPLCLEDRLIGSGTLIAWDDRVGILTALHVPGVAGLDFTERSTQRLGTVLKQGAHYFSMPMNRLHLIEIGAPTGAPENGPDLAVIEIPTAMPELGRLRAIRSFKNLSVNTEANLSRALEDGDLTAIVGNPAEKIQDRGPEGAFDNVRQLYGMTGFGGIGRRWSRDEFDYFEFEVDYASTDDLPISFEGVSGGGVWLVPLRRGTSADSVTSDPPILAGVAYFQSPLVEARRLITCHGGRSVHETTLRRLRGQ